jgi:hypothetical protein
MHNNFVRKREKQIWDLLVSEIYNANHYSTATQLLNVKIKSYIKLLYKDSYQRINGFHTFSIGIEEDWNSLGERANCESFNLYLSKKHCHNN